MADMEVTIRLRWETGDDGVMLSARQILGDDFTDEVCFVVLAHVRRLFSRSQGKEKAEFQFEGPSRKNLWVISITRGSDAMNV